MNAPHPVPSIWTTGSTEGNHTGTWRAATPRHITAPSPCHQACPVGGEIATWIGQARNGDLQGAWRTLMRHNPFPSIAGRICHHPCEAACNRAGHDEALSICRLERYVGDQAIAQRWAAPGPAAHPAAGHVAVVGGGPAGLSAAYQLRRAGHRVTLYEAAAELGGVMRYGIPAYRLSREVLDAEIARIVALGVEVRCGQAVAGADALDALARTHDAVFVALGAQRPKALPQVDATRPWFMDGAHYLGACSRGEAPALGPRVVVVGGGSAAIDVARSARRQGHAVTLLALERRAQMPAQHDEVDEALEEGIALVDGAQLRAVDEGAAAGGALALRCQRVEFLPGAQRGRFELRPVEGSDFTLAADAVLSAIGQDPRLDDLGPALRRAGALLWTDAQGQTSDARVWAGGDLASMARFVTEAVGMGERAAGAIDRALRARAGLAVAEPGPTYGHEPVVPLSAISLYYHPAQARAASPRRPAAERVADQDEVQLGLEVAQALAEAERCFSCGSCIHCDQCVTYCPDLAVRRVGEGYVVNTDYCKGCGVCVRECPTGSMAMSEDTK